MHFKASAAAEYLNRVLGTNESLIECLRRLATLNLPSCYLGAGCVAQTVWNVAHSRPPNEGIRDYDILYFDPDLSADAENSVVTHAQRLLADLPIRPDVKNQARVHLWYGSRFGYEIQPYTSCEDAIATWPTTATAVAVRHSASGLHVEAPFGLHDLFELIVRPNRVQITPGIYDAKIERWRTQWPRLIVKPWTDGVGAIGSRRAI